MTLLTQNLKSHCKSCSITFTNLCKCFRFENNQLCRCRYMYKTYDYSNIEQHTHNYFSKKMFLKHFILSTVINNLQKNKPDKSYVQADATTLNIVRHWCVNGCNNSQQHATTCNRVCKRTQHITSNNVESCLLETMLRQFAWGFMFT